MKKGFSLVEIIISVGLIAVVMLFLFQILSDLQYEETTSNFASGNQMNRANIIKKVEEDFNSRFVKKVKVDKKEDDSETNVTFLFQEGGSSILTITPKTISYKNGNLEVNKDTFTYRLDDENYEYSRNIIMTTDLERGEVSRVNLFCEDDETSCGNTQFHYVKIRIPVINKKDENNNIQDDIELFYVGPYVENANKYKKYTLRLDIGSQTNINVNRTSAERPESDTGPVLDKEAVYEHDMLKIGAMVTEEGYTLTSLTVNNQAFSNNGTYKVKDIEPDGEVVIQSRATLNEYRMTIKDNSELPVKLTKVYSKKDNTETNTVLPSSSSVNVNHGDRIKIEVVEYNTAKYENIKIQVNNGGTNSIISSGDTITVKGAVTIDRTATIKSYVQTIQVRYEDASGTWGNYATKATPTMEYGEEVTYKIDKTDTYAETVLEPYTVTGTKTVQISVPRNRSTNIIQVRYQNPDGTYGSYSNAKNESLRVGQTVSWSRAQDDTYVAASASITATKDNQTKQVSVNRRTSTNKIRVRYQNADGSYGGYTEVVNKTFRVGEAVSYTRAQDATYVAANFSYTATATGQSKDYNINRRTSTNIIQVRYQNADGSYGGYSNVVNTTHRVGQTVSWSRGQDATYNAGSSSFTATASNQTKQISITRRTYALTVNKGTGISSVSGAGTYRAGQAVTISASVTSGYRFNGWTKNAGTIANANATSTTFTMPTSAATVTANAVVDGLLPQMTRYYTGFEIYRDYSGTGVDRYAAAWSVNSANTGTNSINTYAKVNNGKSLWVYAKRNYLSSESLNHDDYEGHSGLVSANKVNLTGKSKIEVKGKLTAKSTGAIAANIQCDLQIKYSTGLPSWTDGNDRGTRTAAGKTFRTFANSYTQFTGAKVRYSSSSNVTNQAVTVTGTFSGMNNSYYIMVTAGAYSNSQHYVDCSYTIDSITVS